MLSIQTVSDGGKPQFSELRQRFVKKFGLDPKVIVEVPGRVNIIGEHIDYCGYGVLPMAIEPSILVAVAETGDRKIQLANIDEEKYPMFELDLKQDEIDIDKNGHPHWWKYFLCGLKGVVQEISGFKWGTGIQAMISGTIPPSSGLSSSSAVVVAGALVTLAMSQSLDVFSRTELADLCAKSERFIGTEGGGMDQAIELLAQEGCAKLIEFKPLVTTTVHLPKGSQFVVINSLSPANKAASSEFNQRVVECRLASILLAKKLDLDDYRSLIKLKEVQTKSGHTLEEMLDIVEKYLHKNNYTKEELSILLELSTLDIEAQILTPNTSHLTEFKLYQRAHHVYSEASRVYQYKRACETNESLIKLGDLMYKSHESCKDSYECSAPMLDKLVNLAKKHGAYGARLTGAGWGGCIVTLIPEDQTDTFIENMKNEYFQNCPAANGLNPSTYIFPTIPGQGAAIYNII